MKKIDVIDLLTSKKDKYDPNTICGCLNRIQRLKEKQLLSEKYTLNPKDDMTAWVFWKLQEASFWPADEFDYSRLQGDYEKSSPALKYALDIMNGWFAGGDGIIVKNIGFRFAIEATSMAETGALLTQMKQEFVHAESYLKSIEAMIKDPIYRDKVLKLADNLPCVRDKELLMEKYMESDIPKAHRIIAFAASEGIMFFGSFGFVFWLRSIGIFPVLAELNEKISYDESMHRDYGCARYRELPESEKPPLEHVIAMIQEFVDLEIAFANELSKGLEEEGYDFTPTVAKKFIHFMANSLLLGLGYESHWEDAEYPDYMRGISNSQKSNFYEVNVAAYSQFSLDKIFKDSNETDQIEFDVDKVDF